VRDSRYADPASLSRGEYLSYMLKACLIHFTEVTWDNRLWLNIMRPPLPLMLAAGWSAEDVDELMQE
jgi:hypothetical protein